MGNFKRTTDVITLKKKISNSLLNARHLVAGPLNNPSTFLLIPDKLLKMSTATRLVDKMEPNKHPWM